MWQLAMRLQRYTTNVLSVDWSGGDYSEKEETVSVTLVISVVR